MATLEIYNPHWCARKFSYYQIIPHNTLKSKDLLSDLYIFVKSWRILLHHKTDSVFSFLAYDHALGAISSI